MPQYEYECKCGGKFEAHKAIEERHNAQCPYCGELASKVMSVVNHTFGWTLSDRSHERFGPRDEFVKAI
jgi:putative FmdB family regulatory protein